MAMTTVLPVGHPADIFHWFLHNCSTERSGARIDIPANSVKIVEPSQSEMVGFCNLG